MNEIKFTKYLIETGHTKKSIVSRISKLKSIEEIFSFNIDTIIQDKRAVTELLVKIRNEKLEDRKHTPLSNSLRKYYEAMTNDHIGRIF